MRTTKIQALLNKLKIGQLVKIELTPYSYSTDGDVSDLVYCGYVTAIKASNYSHESLKLNMSKYSWALFSKKILLRDIEKLEVLE